MENKSYKYFYCKPCKFAWKSEFFLTDGDNITALCPICEKSSPECNHSTYNLSRTAWKNSTGPKTEAGKARSSLNAWKDGTHCTKFHVMAPAKFDSYHFCGECDQRIACEVGSVKYCAKNTEVTSRFLQAYIDGDVNELREMAGWANAQMMAVFSAMVHNILTHGVMIKTIITDSKGKEKEILEKNQLVKELPGYVASLGFNADSQVMTPKAVEQKEALEGFIKKDIEEDQQTIIDVKRQANEELKRMREALENMEKRNEVRKRLEGD